MQLNKRQFLMGTAALAMAGHIGGARAASAISYWHHFTSQSEWPAC